MVCIAGHHLRNGPPTIMLNHHNAALIAIAHLAGLGHKRIAFMVGQSWSQDTKDRWKAIQAAARTYSIIIHPDLVITLDSTEWSADLGYGPMLQLLARTRDFTALFAFNDTAAMGAIRALIDHGLSVPDQISVLGFDDVGNAAFFIPRLTTIRQPLQEMGRAAAERLLGAINSPNKELPECIRLEPELVVRESTAPAPNRQ
jgi:DNA-binding LacI/PurR family transcriptional regulator